MTATQSFKIYEVLHKHFKNDADAKVVVQEIEVIIDNKFEKEKNNLSTKEDIGLLKQDLLKFQIDIEKRLNSNLIWLMATIISVGALIVAFIKILK
jgi:hypothetical protein